MRFYGVVSQNTCQPAPICSILLKKDKILSSQRIVTKKMWRKFYEFKAKVDSIFSHVGLTQNSCRGRCFGDNYQIGILQRTFFKLKKISGKTFSIKLGLYISGSPGVTDIKKFRLKFLVIRGCCHKRSKLVLTLYFTMS